MGKPKDMSLIVQPTPGLHEAVAGVATADLRAAVRIRAKLERQQALQLIDARVQTELSQQARARPCCVLVACTRFWRRGS